MSDIEKINHAAVMSDTGWIFIGKCHGDCFYKMDNIGLSPFHKPEGQGFITSKGRFVFRDKAADIAFKAKQIDKETNFLCSEDLWCPTYNGKHEYCELVGYKNKSTENTKENKQ